MTDGYRVEGRSRFTEDDERIVAVNFGREGAVIRLPEGAWIVEVSTHTEARRRQATVRLSGDEAVV